MLCKKCGASVPDSTYECPFCKAKLGSEPPVAEEEVKAVEEEIVEEDVAEANEEIFDENEINRKKQIKRMLDEKQQQLSEIQDRRESKRKKQQRKKILIVAAICVLVSIAVGSGAYFISNNTSRRQSVTISTPSPEPTAEVLATESPEPTLDPSLSPSPEASELPVVSETPDAGQSWQPVDTDTSTGSGSGSGSSASSGSSSASSGSTSASSNASSGSSSGTKKSSTTKKNNTSTSKPSTSTSTSSGSTSASSSGSSSTASTSKAKASGVTTKRLSGTVARGGKVVVDQATGNSIMTFVSDGVEYYGFVSKGSTTAQVSGKPMTLSAVPTGYTYNGNTVYEINSLNYMDNGYIIKDSSTRRLGASDLAGLSKEQLGYARNEIFARHGRPFKKQKYREYFESCSWYKVNPNYNLNDDKSNLNSIEKANVDLIMAYENR